VFFSCRTSYVVNKQENSQYRFSDSTLAEVDSSVNREITPYREKMKAAMNEVLAVSTSPMERGLPESRLGNFLADACKYESEKAGKIVDVAVFNTGGLRRPLPQGNITRGDVYELMPFENELVILTLNGEDVKKIFNFIATKGGAPVSGVRMVIKDSIATSVLIHDQPLESNRTYNILTSDYLANGGDAFPFGTDVRRDPVNIKVRDAIINYLQSKTKSGEKINVEPDGRIVNDR
jgi:2',3'-cyclic-nucleotide 2'-phosphodiesterase (5'-nucleotidase family)